MAVELDLVIRNGIVVDGTGRPAFEADVGVADGRIAEIGHIAASGAEEIDARGKLVTPGFVDIHTHYDGQAVWDPHMAPSSWHGVTTVVMGNCGVGFAPCKPADREKLVELMEGVEDIPGAVMHEGLSWEWESFDEYLQALERRARDVDVCALLPHAAVRVFVMGDRAVRLENANQGDIAQMREIAADAMRAGAFGFSTSRTTSHKSLHGDYTPTLRAQEEELSGIALGLRDAGTGFIEMVSEWTQPSARDEFAMFRRVVERSGRPAVFSLAQRTSQPDAWKELMGYADKAIAEGVSIRPVVPPRGIGVLLGLEGSQNPFSGTPTYKPSPTCRSPSALVAWPTLRSARKSCRTIPRPAAPSRCSTGSRSTTCSASAIRRTTSRSGRTASAPLARARAARRRRSLTTCCSRTRGAG